MDPIKIIIMIRNLLPYFLLFVTLVSAGPPLQIRRPRGSPMLPPKNEEFERLQHFGKFPTTTTSTWENQNLDEIFEPRFRLPVGLIKPLEYTINIIPILDQAPSSDYEPWTAPGWVKISVLVQQATSQIHLNKDKDTITVLSVQVTQGSQVLTVTGHAYDGNGLYVISLDSALSEGGEYEILIEFVTLIPLAEFGLYRAVFLDENDNEKWMATTQMSPIGFRRFVPGFDEPNLKANFTVNIGRMAGVQMSLANSAVDQTGVSDSTLIPALPPGYVWDKYPPTVKMSTFLVAVIVVPEYTAVFADENVLGKPVGVYGPPHLIARGGGDLAAENSAATLKFFEETFQIDYPMQKSFSVAIPRNYYHFSAMENWGLNTYRDDVLLYYPGESLESGRNRLFSVMAHELAHQWWGNLISPAWWGSVWLKEGFATYFSFLGVSQTAPEYDAQNQFLYDTVQSALLVDAAPTSHPITNEGTQEQVETLSIFDAISYDKGASLVRMMQGFLGLPTLMKGLKNYLNEMKFEAVVEADLFRILNEAAVEDGKIPTDTNLSTIMETWTLQKGFPLVRISRAGDTRIYISQERFSADGPPSPENRDFGPNELWEIPVALATGADPNFEDTLPKFWIHKNILSQSFQIDTTKWLIANPGGFGYFRILYDPPLTTLIQKQLIIDHTIVSPLTKSQLIDDYFKLADAGYIDYESALGMTKFLGQKPQDSDHTFWFPALTAFENIFPILSHDPTAFENLKAYLTPKVTSELDYLKWDQMDNEHGVKVLLRVSLLDWACALESESCYDMASQLVTAWRTEPSLENLIPVDLQQTVYCGAVAAGLDENVAHIKAQYKNESTSPAQKNLLVGALACSQDFVELLELVRNSIEPAQFAVEHLSTILKNVAANPAGGPLAAQFVRDNWEKILAYLIASENDDEDVDLSNLLALNIFTITAYQHTQSEFDELENLIADIELKNPTYLNATRSYFDASLAAITKNIKWASTHMDSVSQWLAEN